MAKARAIVKRRKAVVNIRKITRTMQLIASSRWPKALKRAQATQPYTAKITEMVETLAGQSIDHPLLRPNEGVKQALLLTITSNRGLCGSYNAAVLRSASDHYRRLTAEGMGFTFEVVGKKAVNYCKFLNIPVASAITDVEDKISYARVAEMAERLMKLYADRQLSRVDVAYTKFHSIGVQRPVVVQLLPIEPPKAEAAAKGSTTQFEFSPEPAVLLARLIPETVKIRLFQYFNDAIVSEQIARMVAMKAATDAAGDMVKGLTREYNRARQSQITTELADIVGGANAVQ